MKTFSQYFAESMNKQKALEFIKKAHEGQKYGSSPYWTHPKAVADAGKKFFGSKFDEKAYMAALLHDVIEDTPYKEAELKKLGFDDEILDAVKLLTKDKSMSYADNIQRIISSGNRRAMMVKYADNYMNFTGDKSGWDPEKKAASQAKYKKSINTIAGKLGVKSNLPENFNSLAERYMKSLNALGEALGVKSDWTLDEAAFYYN
jgi:GTP diphosphokinase / guanosine-3',5'-bis(diphosphate) 3'-diphosphatase